MSEDNNKPTCIYSAIQKVMGKVGAITKDGHNDFQNYDYATEASLLKDLRPAMIDAGLVLIPSGKTVSPIDEHGNVFVEIDYTVAEVESGHSIKVTAYGCGNDRNSKGGVGDKGLYKALTGANKYLLFKLFQIATQDDPEKNSDGDNAPTKKTSKAKATPGWPNAAKPKDGCISEKQQVRFHAIAETKGWQEADIKMLMAEFDVEHTKDITWRQQYPEMIARLEAGVGPAESDKGLYKAIEKAGAGPDDIPF